MIRIELVKLVGRTVSDRWNLATLGLATLANDRNQTAIKRARRANPEFTFVVVRSATLATLPTLTEQAAFTLPTLPDVVRSLISRYVI
jgi:hypothetical protein